MAISEEFHAIEGACMMKYLMSIHTIVLPLHGMLDKFYEYFIFLSWQSLGFDTQILYFVDEHD